MFSFAVGGWTVVLLAWPASAQTATTTAWPQLQGDAAHTGARADAPQPPFDVGWTGRPGATVGQHLSAPVVSGDTAVVTGPGGLYALNVAGGGLAWSAERDAVPVAPAIASVGGSELVVSTTGRGRETSSIDAVDLETGTSAWDAPLRLEDESRSGVTVDGARAFVGDEGGTLYAVDLAAGSIEWTASTGGNLAGPVAASDGIVVGVVAASDVNRSAAVVAFDEASGDELWTVTPDAAATFGSLPTIVGSVAVVAFPDGEVVALSTQDGSESWRERIPALVSPFVAPAVAGRSLVFADSNGGVHLVTPGGGPRWVFEFNQPILRASPVVAGDTVVVGFEDGSVGAVSLDTGHLVFRTAPTDAPVGGIALTPEAVVISRGGVGVPELVGFRTDPGGTLLDVPSPTDPVASRLAVGFVLAVVVAAAIYVPGRLVAARVAIADPSVAEVDAAESDDAEST